MIKRLFDQEINAEIITTFVFMVLSFLYITTEYGYGKVIDVLFLWMFPASVMIFLTLLIVKIIEKFHNRTKSRYHYIDWRKG